MLDRGDDLHPHTPNASADERGQDPVLATLDAIPVALLVWREDGVILVANEAAAAMLGYTLEALRGVSYWDITLPGQKQREIDLARQGDVPYTTELVRADGRTITGRVVGIRAVESGGVAAHLIVFTADAAPAPARDVDAVLRRQNGILLELAKSDVVDSGDLARALAAITESAAAGLGCERSSVWIYTEDKAGLVCLDLFRRTGRDHTSGAALTASDFPRYFEALAEDRALVATDAHAHPATRELAAPYLAPLGVRSVLDAPIRLRGKRVGVLRYEHVGPARLFAQEEQSFAASLADMVARALEAAEARRAEVTLALAREELERRATRLEATVAARTGELGDRGRESAGPTANLHAALDALSTPVIEVWEGTLAMPLVGAFDQERGDRAIERLLEEVDRTRTRCVILDLTGMVLYDATTAAQIVSIAKAVELLGVECLLTGIKPAVAQALAKFNLDLPPDSMQRTIKQALQHALELAREESNKRPSSFAG